jgi:hydrogenase maturation protease
MDDIDDIDGKILVMGVGNILLRDEGIGVRVMERLEQDYEFSDNVALMDGGCRGIILTDPISRCAHLIVIDAVLGDGPPGTVYRLEGDDLRRSMAFKNSMHDLDLLETLTCCELIGNRPPAVVVGIEPKDFQTSPGLDISPELVEKMDEMAKMALAEIKAAGGSWTLRPDAAARRRDLNSVPSSTAEQGQ